MWISTDKSGLCNRLKSLISALRLDRNAKVYWVKNHKVRCYFSDLFKNDIEIKRVPQDARIYNNWRFCLIRNGDLYIPEDESEYYDRMYDATPTKDKEEILNVISSFVFNDYVQSQVDSLENSEDCISVQIRTWHEAKGTPKFESYDISKYFTAIDKLDPRKLFVTSDNPNPVRLMRKRYGDRVVVYPKRTKFGDRNSRKGMQDITVDFLLSSKNNVIIGDKLSTFTELSWWFGGCKANVITV